jgi:hypothetical protein
VRQLYVVVNKIDVLGDTDREEVLSYIQTRVEQLLGTGNAHLLPLSARDGLTAKLNHDEAGIHRSGLASFEQTLTAFLAEEQGRIFLVSVLDHALRILDEADLTLATASTEGEIETQGSALELRRTMESLRVSLMAGVPLSAVGTVTEPAPVDLRVIDQVIDTSRSQARRSPSWALASRGRVCVAACAGATGWRACCARWCHDSRSRHCVAVRNRWLAELVAERFYKPPVRYSSKECSVGIVRDGTSLGICNTDRKCCAQVSNWMKDIDSCFSASYFA